MLGLLIAVKYANCGEQLQADCCTVCSAEEATDWKYCNSHDRNRTQITLYSVHPDSKYVVWKYCNIQGATQKVLDNCYKTQINSYMDMIYFYSSKYIPPWSIHLFAHSFNFFMPSRKAVFEMLLSSLVTAHWISSTAWKCRPFKEIFNLGKRK